MTRTSLIRKLLLGALAAHFLSVSGKSFYDHRHLREPVVLGPGVTRVTTLAEYNPTLRGTVNDANLYVLEGKEPGGTIFVFGGTHAEEPAGRLAAWLLVEHATLERGRLIVALTANRAPPPSPARALRIPQLTRSRRRGAARPSGWVIAGPTRSTSR